MNNIEFLGLFFACIILMLLIIKTYSWLGLNIAKGRSVSLSVCAYNLGCYFVQPKIAQIKGIEIHPDYKPLGTYHNKTGIITLDNSSAYSSSVLGHEVLLHEAGHALQQEDGYHFYALMNFFHSVSYVSIFGIAGSFCYAFAVQTTLSTILCIFFMVLLVISKIAEVPIELDATRRALELARELSIYTDEDIIYMKKALKAAAFTYIASGLELLLLVIILLIASISKGKTNTRRV